MNHSLIHSLVKHMFYQYSHLLASISYLCRLWRLLSIFLSSFFFFSHCFIFILQFLQSFGFLLQQVGLWHLHLQFLICPLQGGLGLPALMRNEPLGLSYVTVTCTFERLLSGLFVITLPLVDMTIVIIMTIIIIIFFISLFIFIIILLVDLRWQRYGKMMTLEKDFP